MTIILLLKLKVKSGVWPSSKSLEIPEESCWLSHNTRIPRHFWLLKVLISNLHLNKRSTYSTGGFMIDINYVPRFNNRIVFESVAYKPVCFWSLSFLDLRLPLFLWHTLPFVIKGYMHVCWIFLFIGHSNLQHLLLIDEN